MGNAVRTETRGRVRRLTLCRPERYDAITPELREAVRQSDRPFGDYGERASGQAGHDR